VEVVRSTKEVKNGKGIRVCRRKSAALKARELKAKLEPQPKPQLEPAPWKALVARMY